MGLANVEHELCVFLEQFTKLANLLLCCLNLDKDEWERIKSQMRRIYILTSCHRVFRITKHILQVESHFEL